MKKSWSFVSVLAALALGTASAVGTTVPANTTFKVGAYGVGQDIRMTYPTGDVFLTSAADTDAGALNSGRVTVSPGAFVLVPDAKFTVCFRATIG
ncbi:hypothetical protein [Deinococcus sp. QL22]|uniref:hypothetical protein n=1 Tax=Deinococcus sp. QL22 TaxID=2939437 RepID=UPI0020179C53|nr:hypothetical protein [Deinococcus sp. QL22]UQN07275.1 hypothetical protein M1R55_05045 [Deinococcus sp. QL22]